MGERRGDYSCQQPNCFYNELVADADAWRGALPGIIEAVFYVAGHWDAERQARDIHQRLCEEYSREYTSGRMTGTLLLSLELADEIAPFKKVAAC